MKLAILSSFFVVLLAQTHAAQETPLTHSIDAGKPTDPLAHSIDAGKPTDPLEHSIAAGKPTDPLEHSIDAGKPTDPLEHSIDAGKPTAPLEHSIDAGKPTDLARGANRTFGHVATQTTADIIEAFAVGRHLNAKKIVIGDPASTAKAHLTNVADQVIQIIENTLKSISNFSTGLSSFIDNSSALLSNPIGTIHKSIAGLSSTINSVDFLKIAAHLASQGDAKARANKLPALITENDLVVFAVETLPISIRPDLNDLNAISVKVGRVLITASRLTHALARHSAAGTKPNSTLVLPITAALNHSVNSIADAVNSVPATINNTIHSLENAGAKIRTVCSKRLKDVVSGLTSIGTDCVDKALNITYGIAAEAIDKSVLCATNEIATLQNYLTKYENLAAQYQTGIANHTISASTLHQTVKISFALKLYLLTVKVRVEGCIATTVLKASGTFIPVAVSAFKCVEKLPTV